MKTELIKYGLSMVIFCMLLPALGHAQYNEAWQEVEKYEEKELPKSALEEVEKIYSLAKKNKHNSQVIKALCYKMKYKNDIEDNVFPQLLNDVKQEIKSSDFPLNAILSSMLAEMYWWYYSENSWTFYDRTPIAGDIPENIELWDLNTIVNQVIKYYNLSIERASELQKIDVNNFSEIITKQKADSLFRPTLYDFLAHRAASFFSNNEAAISRPADQFYFDKEIYLAPAENFTKISFETDDTLSLKFHALKIYQDILKFRLEANQKEPLFDAELIRLNFVYSYSTHPLKDSLYFTTLIDLQKKTTGLEISTEVAYLIADFYRTNTEFPRNVENRFKEAEKICNQAIADFPNSLGAGNCKQLLNILHYKNLGAKIQAVTLPNEVFPALINYQNIPKIYVRIATMPNAKYVEMQKDYYGTNLFDNIYKEAQTVATYEFNLPDSDDLYPHSTEILLEGLPTGHYIIFVSNNSDFLYNENTAGYEPFQVSDLSFMCKKNDTENIDLYTISRKTGNPLPEINVEAHYSVYDYSTQKYTKVILGNFTTDKKGYIKIKPDKKVEAKNIQFNLYNKKDTLIDNSGIYYSTYKNKEAKSYKTYFFLDRAIYRPAQTVYFKGILIAHEGDKREIVPNEKTVVKLYDVNYKVISELELTTNDFGSFQGSFVLPNGLLNGRMQISTRSGVAYFSVEEYKRPKFEVQIDDFAGDYKLNDSVLITGIATAYAGAAIGNSKVKYRVMRTPDMRFCWWLPQLPVEIDNGECLSDEKGKFQFKFLAKPDENTFSQNNNKSFRYSITIDVTDITGETRSAQKTLTVGNVNLVLDLDIESEIDLSNQTIVSKGIEITTENLNNQFVESQGTISFYKIPSQNEALLKRLWETPDKFIYTEDEWNTKFPGNEYLKAKDTIDPANLVFELKFNTATDKFAVISDFAKWEPARYGVVIKANDNFGTEVKKEIFFNCINTKSKKPDLPTIFNYKPIKLSGEPTENASFLIASSKKINVLFEVLHGTDVIESKWVTLNNSQQIIEIPILEKYRGGFTIATHCIFQNRYFSYSDRVSVPYTNKELSISFESFRDKLLPGENETWKLKIKGNKAENVAAEMLALLYDASLDQFTTNNWAFDIFPAKYGSSLFSVSNFGIENLYFLDNNFNKYSSFSQNNYSEFNWFNFNYYRVYYSYSKSYAERSVGQYVDMAQSADVAIETNTEFISLEEEEEETNIYDQSLDGLTGGIEVIPVTRQDTLPAPAPPTESLEKEIEVRKNFNETAFFYPQLENHENGEISINFTVPESLTKWKMKGFAHTKDLSFGFVENQLITTKSLMVVPNAPRFFRQGDKITFAAKINNLSEKTLSGQVKIEFFDAISLQPIANIFTNRNQIQDFTVESQLTGAVSWDLQIPETSLAITYRISATAGDFTDAEETTIPVLTNRMLVTESLPLWIKNEGEKSFEFTKLKNSEKSTTLKHHKLTLEFTSNPAWYAIQALPYLIEYPYECYEQIFSRYYANSIATHIANSSPKIKSVFESWKNAENSTALLSNLEKNQELKSILLQETPWVLDAENESERKKRIGLLFDLNKMSTELTSALLKLQNGQKQSGGWPWFEGMIESRYITQHIISGLGHLIKLNVFEFEKDNNEDVNKMISKALIFLDNKIEEDYKWLKNNYSDKELKENHLSYSAIQYLYARSFFPTVEVSDNAKESFDYYFEQAKKYWTTQSKYMQGLIALVLHRYEKSAISNDIIASLKEYSMLSDEMGMYWKENVAGYYWYQAPIEFQALMIEVFTEITNETEAIDEMRVWLLKNKQTNDWKTTRATVEAVYALLLQGTEWLENNESVEISVGNKTIDPQKIDGIQAEAGTGYFKTSWAKGEITPQMADIKINKKSKGVAWGAVYWQYFENLDKITAAETPLSVEKKLYKTVLGKSGESLELIEEATALQVGDIITVRMVLKTDREMEYIHLKDMRAAGFEPLNVFSGYRWQDGLGYYETTKDASTNFFIADIQKGSYVFEYKLVVSHAGDFSNGITSIQCMYAPEFSSHSEGIRVQVKK